MPWAVNLKQIRDQNSNLSSLARDIPLELHRPGNRVHPRLTVFGKDLDFGLREFGEEGELHDWMRSYQSVKNDDILKCVGIERSEVRLFNGR